MNKFIVNSTADKPLGLPTQKKCHKVSGGPDAGRLAVVYAASANTIALAGADPPYSDFSSPVNIVTDADDSPFDSFMDDDGNILIAYTVQTSRNLAFVRVTFENGSWTPGTPVTVYDADENYDPCLLQLPNGYIWIAYTRLSGGAYYISAKCSTDGGQSWGSTSSPGDTLTGGSTEALAVMVRAGEYLYVFYNDGGSKIAYRRKLTTGAVWNSEVILATTGGYGQDLAAAVDTTGKIGLAYVDSSGLKFREFSGSSWSSENSIDEDGISRPVVAYHEGTAYLLYAKTFGSGMEQVRYAKKQAGSFGDPQPLDDRKSGFAKVILFNESSGSYEDKTEQAASTANADVYHSVSGCLLSALKDAVFIGMNRPFHFLRVILSTAGSGGEVTWKYWDGQVWKSFTPHSGAWHFTGSPEDVLLWPDYCAIPGDWQKKSVDDQDLYWISITVSSAYATGPVGTQLSSVSDLKALTGRV